MRYFIRPISELVVIDFDDSPNDIQTVRKSLDGSQFICKFQEDNIPVVLRGQSNYSREQMLAFIEMDADDWTEPDEPETDPNG